MKLVATRPFRYRTRRLEAGDEFEERNDTFARVLVIGRRAKPADEAKPAPAAKAEPVKPPPPAEQPPPDLDELREEAEALGIDVDGRWGVIRLQHEIAMAKEQ